MSSQLSNLSAALPPVGTAAVVPGSPGGVGADAPPLGQPLPPPLPGDAGAAAGAATGGGAPVPAAPDDPRVVALLQNLVAVVSQIVAISAAQAGAGGVMGGGANAAPSAIVAPESLRSAAAGNGGGVGGGASWSGAYSLEAVAASVPGGVIGGGPGSGSSVGAALSGTSLGGWSGAGWSIDISGAAAGPAPQPVAGGGGNATSIATILGAGVTSPAAAPAAAQPAVTGGGAAAGAPQVDMRRISGTPQPGGVIDLVLRSATANAAESRSEGTWIVLGDAGGAQLQAHAHGAWASHPTRVAEGIQRGYVQVHVHEDGTLHLHDVV